MFTELDRKKKNWRSDKRTLRKARNKVKRLERKLKDKRYETPGQKKEIADALADARVKVSVYELKVGDKPE